MKKRFLIVALFALFLGGIAVAQSQEQASTLTELQAEKEKLEAKLAKVLEEKENAENSLVDGRNGKAMKAERAGRGMR